MFNLRWAVIPAGAAFALAILLSLFIGQVGFGLAIVRALIFAALFFGIGCGAWFIVSTQLPELLLFEEGAEEEEGDSRDEGSDDGRSGGHTGSNVNITLGDHVGDATQAALPGNSYGIEGIGSISELVSGNVGREQGREVDQTGENDYTDSSGGFAFAPMPGGSSLEDESGEESGSLGDFSVFFDGLPTGKNASLGAEDSMSDLFESLASAGPSSRPDEVLPVGRKTAVGKPPEMSADFSPKELAMGIRTALASEKRG